MGVIDAVSVCVSLKVRLDRSRVEWRPRCEVMLWKVLIVCYQDSDIPPKRWPVFLWIAVCKLPGFTEILIVLVVFLFLVVNHTRIKNT